MIKNGTVFGPGPVMKVPKGRRKEIDSGPEKDNGTRKFNNISFD